MHKCKCSFHSYMVGDGCDECNPAKALDYAYETIDELRAEVERLRDYANDAHGGLEYIKQCHGTLYGVGWDRLAEKYTALEAGYE